MAAAAVVGGLSLLQGFQEHELGKIEKGESKVVAKQIDLQVTQREADRKERLAEALASQSASAGSRGISGFSGSPLAIMEEDILREEKATERDLFNAKLEKMTTLARGSLAAKTATSNALLGFGTDALSSFTSGAGSLEKKKSGKRDMSGSLV